MSLINQSQIPKNKPFAPKYRQLDLNFTPKEETLSKDLLNWGPFYYPTGEKIDPNDWHSEEKEARIELINGKWFIDSKEANFNEVIDIIGIKGTSASITMRDEKFVKIKEFFERKSATNK